MNYHRYRWCIVSSCPNTSIRTTEKLFIKVPDDIKMRNVWLKLAKRDPKSLSIKSRLYLCEDHFNLEQDMANYMEYKIMGSVKHIKMKVNTIPSRFSFNTKKKCRSPSARRSTLTNTQGLDVPGTENSKLSEDYIEPTATSSKSDFHNSQVLGYRIKLEEEICNDAPETNEPLFQVNVDMERENEPLIKDEIKMEEDHPQCHICLSVGRKMFPIRKYEEIYKRLLYDEYQDHGDVTFDATLVCWECNALLRNVEQFQNRIRQANEMLQMQQNIVSLSSLTTVVFSDSSPNSIYLEESEENTRYQMNSENDDQIKDHGGTSDKDSVGEDEPLEELTKEEEETPKEKTVDRNKWAKRRVLVNREPKFRMIEDFSEMFKKVSFSIKILQEVLEERRKQECYTNSEFRCSSCIQRFDNREALMEHNIQYHDKSVGMYVCDICRSRFADVQSLSSHLFSHYYMFYCKLCDYKCYSEDDTRSHARAQHGSKAMECLKCNGLFSARREFYKHYRDVHETHICDYCGLRYKLKDSLITHIRKKHSTRECNICKKTFTRYNSLWLHNKVHHGPPTATAYCVECDVEYADPYRYKWHLANSVRHRPREAVRVRCPGCDKEFSKKIYMKNHYDLVHLKLTKFKCDACQKYFGRNADLAKHRRRVHEGVQPPKNKICHICGRGFTVSVATFEILANHTRTHTQRQLACPHCPARFAHKRVLASHMRAMHPS
ncbi:PR domain zinc finger protein 5-like isoform X2 [Vanessa tameamea]|uniref:PR domain zinc finger protein 5-like isoform X2 n=1 Tax=Vanessa tameamea TaxID=334116 RepID=A0ABM4AY12_VANTA